MTAFTPSTDIPTAIDSLEKYLAHAFLTANNLYSTLTYQELPGALLERVCDASIITAADGTVRLIGRFSIELDQSYITGDGSSKLWTFAKSWGDGTVPAAYKVD
jgi:hypothetical protein